MNSPSSVALLAIAIALAGCSSGPKRSVPEPGSQASGRPAAKPPGGGGYYKDDGPGDNAPDLDNVTDAVPRVERPHRFANNPYQVFGKDYVPVRVSGDFRQRGVASWYGRRYHGQKTSSGEIYDMHAMTAAHPTLPIPSYARVTSVSNGKSVVVRINDRGPFLSDRVIDLSYVAAYKLGYIQAGSTLVDVEVVTPDTPLRATAAPPVASPAVAMAPLSPATPSISPPLPVSADASGVYLQLGAFSMRDNAESFRARVYKDLAWLNDSMQVNAQGGLFR
ncbi:MAG: septal ring lytic transglycosylase RlpA family protein, partial [Deltaproteobacteria bacterium]|nr:septal ring lytic transglycosylase RlpA family protein [Deltaproteobacteria bacterium]